MNIACVNEFICQEKTLEQLSTYDFKRLMKAYYKDFIDKKILDGENMPDDEESEDHITQFWKYKTGDKDLAKTSIKLFDCDSSNDTCQLTTDIYKTLWDYRQKSKSKIWKWKDKNRNSYNSYGGDTMNSFLTTYNYINEKESGLLGENSDLLNEFALYTHTIGNFVLVPYGFNQARYCRTGDYWDASLDILKGEGFKNRSGYYFTKENFMSYINYFFLWDYVNINGEIVTLFGEDIESRKGEKNEDKLLYSRLTDPENVKQFLENSIYRIKRRGIFMVTMLEIANEFYHDDDNEIFTDWKDWKVSIYYKIIMKEVFLKDSAVYSGYECVLEEISKVINKAGEQLQLAEKRKSEITKILKILGEAKRKIVDIKKD